MEKQSGMFVLLICLITSLILPQTTGRKLRQENNALQQAQIQQDPLDPQQAAYIRNCVTIAGLKPLPQQQSAFKCPGPKDKKSAAQEAAEKRLKDSATYWTNYEKKNDASKYSFAKAKDIHAEPGNSRFKSGTPVWTDKIWPGCHIPWCIETYDTQKKAAVPPEQVVDEMAIRQAFREVTAGTQITYEQVKCDNAAPHKIMFGPISQEEQEQARQSAGQISLGWGRIGYSPRKENKQAIRVMPNEYNYRHLAHEIIHALGFLHTHQRSNAPVFVKTDSDKIAEDRSNCAVETQAKDSGNVYDYRSIMHYMKGPCGLDKKAEQPEGATAEWNQPEKWGKRDNLSPNDKLLIQKMYSAEVCLNEKKGWTRDALLTVKGVNDGKKTLEEKIMEVVKFDAAVVGYHAEVKNWDTQCKEWDAKEARKETIPKARLPAKKGCPGAAKYSVAEQRKTIETQFEKMRKAYYDKQSQKDIEDAIQFADIAKSAKEEARLAYTAIKRDCKT